jgi:NitT/TauT family transport system substrate-binding protein
MAKALSLSEQEIADMAKGVQFMGKEENKNFFNPAMSSNTIYYITDLASKFWTDKGVLKKAVDPKVIVEPRFAQDAAK